jgi:hypothetical protein
MARRVQFAIGMLRIDLADRAAQVTQNDVDETRRGETYS